MKKRLLKLGCLLACVMVLGVSGVSTPVLAEEKTVVDKETNKNGWIGGLEAYDQNEDGKLSVSEAKKA